MNRGRGLLHGHGAAVVLPDQLVQQQGKGAVFRHAAAAHQRLLHAGENFGRYGDLLSHVTARLRVVAQRHFTTPQRLLCRQCNAVTAALTSRAGRNFRRTARPATISAARPAELPVRAARRGGRVV